MRTFQVVLVLGMVLSAGPGQAGDITIVLGNDGRTGVIRDLGGGIGAYADLQGGVGVARDLGGGVAPYVYSLPDEGSRSGLIVSPGAVRSPGPGVPGRGSTPQILLPLTQQDPTTDPWRVEGPEDVRTR